MNRIKELRKKNNLTVTELAKKIGISQSMLTNYENGNATPRNPEIWDKLAQIFGTSSTHVMGTTTDIKQLPQTPHLEGSQILERVMNQQLSENPITVELTTLNEVSLIKVVSLLTDEEVNRVVAFAHELYSKRCGSQRISLEPFTTFKKE